MAQPTMLIVDGHEDIGANAVFHGRDVRRSASEHRAREAGAATQRGAAMVGLPELRAGNVGLVFATIFAAPDTVETMAEKARAQLRYYHDLAAADVGVRLITSQAELATLERDWWAQPEPARRPVGFVLLMEGADGLREPGELETWYRAGLRVMGLSWHATRYAGGTGAPGPLTAMGHELLREMERLGVILDVSHLAEQSFWEALDAFKGTVIAGHANSRTYVPTDRQLSDAMIGAVVGRGGVIGTVLANVFLARDYQHGGDRLPLDIIAQPMQHIRALTGSTRHCALGSDFDGGFGAEDVPVGLETVADLPLIGEMLARAGYREDEVAGVLGGNWLRLLRASLPA